MAQKNLALYFEIFWDSEEYLMSICNNLDLSKNRYQVMNMVMLERHRQYHDGQKFIAFVGSRHVSTNMDVPGVSDLLGCLNIVVSDLEKNTLVEVIEEDIQFNDENETIHFDILYHRSSETKGGLPQEAALSPQEVVSSSSKEVARPLQDVTLDANNKFNNMLEPLQPD